MPSPSELERDGRVWFRRILDDKALGELEATFAADDVVGRRFGWSPAFARALMPVNVLAQRVLPRARPVRVVTFNKSLRNNWTLPWHQDRVIAVRERGCVHGFTNWTRKSDVWHVEPPVEVLEQMIFLRVPLDDEDDGNGCLEIAPGSHSRGKVADDQTEAVANATAGEQCIAERGDVPAVKALVLHRSRATRRTTCRRAIRIDYSADDLPALLQWEFQS